ncbi:uncharacterized protein DNG_07369 [Cephalotrichum gorgonifer]|uniref:FAD-binding domain-containing protein n=1 Tax=Cephalotrichum gorgonifer TaxID=2041049 RepID=A0AAE8N379_9PEZI|nr:uncharacterized protein DNG_07369 [Cephalotrichum gorgonifer]
MATERPHAIILGAGIAGLTAAFWLDKAGWRSTILEDGPIKQGGQMLIISGPGYETLERMGVKGLKHLPFMLGENVVKSSSGKVLSTVGYKQTHCGVRSRIVCRGDLALALAESLPASATIRYNVNLEATQDDGPKFTAELEGGEVLTADLFIGADGQRSVVRKTYWEDEESVCLEHLGYSYATYDVTLSGVLEKPCESYHSPGRLDSYFECKDDRIAALHIWRNDVVKPFSGPTLLYDILKVVTGTKIPTVTKILRAAEEQGSVPIISPMELVTLKNWSRGRVVLLGDAAHCLTPFSGQGAGMAMASAEVLAAELKAVTGEGADGVVKALDRWEKRIRPPIERLQMKSRLVATNFLPKGKPAHMIRSLVAKMLPSDAVSTLLSAGVSDEIDRAEIDELAEEDPQRLFVQEGRDGSGKRGLDEKVV